MLLRCMKVPELSLSNALNEEKYLFHLNCKVLIMLQHFSCVAGNVAVLEDRELRPTADKRQADSVWGGLTGLFYTIHWDFYKSGSAGKNGAMSVLLGNRHHWTLNIQSNIGSGEGKYTFPPQFLYNIYYLNFLMSFNSIRQFEKVMLLPFFFSYSFGSWKQCLLSTGLQWEEQVKDVVFTFRLSLSPSSILSFRNKLAIYFSCGQ